MSVFRLPKHLYEEINKRFSRFWWGSSSNKRKLHWFKWSNLCLPKSLGGLNFRDIEGFNKALIAKQVWRILTNPDSLVAKFLKSLYFKDSNILNADIGKHPSYLWKSLMWGRELICKGLRYRIGNGVDTYMFRDPWIPKELTFKPICIDNNMLDSKVADFITPSGGWDIDKLSTSVINFDIDTIRAIPINTRLKDRLIWHSDKTGKYTVKSGYKLFMNIKIDGISASSTPLTRIWNNLWKLNIPTKIKHFCWRALKESIPNNANLNFRGVRVPTQCPICNYHIENSDHRLFDCPRAREIWKLTYNSIYLDEDFHGCFIDRWMKIDAQSSQEELCLVAVTCWAIWSDRNKVVHGESIPPPQIKSRWIKEYLEAYLHANGRGARAKKPEIKSKMYSSQSECWSPPPDGFWMLNSDASCSSSTPATGLGILIRDKNGKIKAASSIHLEFNLSPLLAELKAVVEGMHLASSLGCSNLIVASDCQMAINFINKKSTSWCEVEAVVENIWSLKGAFNSIDFIFVPRKCNESADCVAKYACVMNVSECWVDNFPSWMCNLVINDLLSPAHVA